MENLRTIVFASHNAHKVEELRRICGDGMRILSLTDIGCTDDIPEDGLTLAENAEAKARWVSERYGLECFADDTGLEVDAIGGAPGVHTARFAGPECDAQANVSLLLKRLDGAPVRTARFRTVIAHIDAHGHLTCFDGVAEAHYSHRAPRSVGLRLRPGVRARRRQRTQLRRNDCRREKRHQPPRPCHCQIN